MSSPEVGASTVRTMYYLSIICARKSIYIANPYFVPDEAAVDALIEAKRRGVDVRIMVSGIHNDNWLARQNSVRLYGRCSRPASRSSNTTGRCCTRRRWWWTRGGRRSGTTNFDNRSFAHNEENNVCVYDAAWARRLHDIFLADLAGCDRVTLDAWRNRGVVQKATEIFASLVQDQI